VKSWLRFGVALAAILFLGVVSFAAALGSIVGSDSCGGCEKSTPLWADVGLLASPILLLGWLVVAGVSAWRWTR